MKKTQRTPLLALALAFLVGFWCLITGAGISFFGAARKGDLPGDTPMPIDASSVFWVMFAASVLLIATWLLWRKIRRGRKL